MVKGKCILVLRNWIIGEGKVKLNVDVSSNKSSIFLSTNYVEDLK